MPDEPTSPGEPIARPIREYIANGAAEGAMLAAQRLSEAIGVGLNEVLDAVQSLGPWEPAATLTAEASLTAVGSVNIPAIALWEQCSCPIQTPVAQPKASASSAKPT